MSTDLNELDGIERDLARTRSRLDATLDELQQKLSPGELMSQAVTYIKEGGGMEFGHNLGRSVRDNPIPVALIGIGLGWLVVANSRKAERRRRRGGTEPRAGGNGNTVGPLHRCARPALGLCRVEPWQRGRASVDALPGRCL